MKQFLLFGLIAICISTTQAQDVDEKALLTHFFIENGMNFSEFDFSSSTNEMSFQNLNFSPQQRLNAGVGFLLGDHFLGKVGVSHEKHKILGRNYSDLLNTHLSYDLDYASINVNVGYMIGIMGRVELEAHAGLSFSKLLSGYQHIGSQTYELNSQLPFQEDLTAFNVGFGALLDLNHHTGVYLKYDLNNGFRMNENNQSFNIDFYSLSIGVRRKISN